MKRLEVLVVLIVLTFGAFNLAAQESVLESKPIVGDADKLELPSSQAFQAEAKPSPSTLRDELKDLPAFIRDTTLKINVRNFYFSRQETADEPGNDVEKVSWGLGGSALLKTGKLYDVFSVHGQLFTSQKLYGPEDKDGALILEPGQEGYTVLGVANPRFEYAGNLVSLYRQRLDLPYVNSQENRMTPNTFENYSYAYMGEGDSPPVQFAAGYLNKIKKRNSEDFVSMSEGAGVVGSERGMPWAGARIRPTKDIKIVGINYYGIDFLNIFYSDVEYALKLSDDWGLKSSMQFSEQRSVGDDLLTGEDVSAAMYGVQQAVSFRKFMVRTAVTVDDKGTNLKSPFGSYAGYNSGITEDYNRAGEIGVKFGISYDFSEVLLDGLSFYSDYIIGNRAVDDDKVPLNDKNELDLNFDYRIKDGLLNGFWLRIRNGFVHEDTVGTAKDFRVILNYDFSLL